MELKAKPCLYCGGELFLVEREHSSNHLHNLICKNVDCGLKFADSTLEGVYAKANKRAKPFIDRNELRDAIWKQTIVHIHLSEAIDLALIVQNLIETAR
jgi:hypothetical protein